ncbi:unnamed protein product [Schistosoma margrebowiei]|uniref:Uncharacterized protein n=1 Tax=Schistosoma margrebowiei TaxID=48269 RepID=A0A183LEJ3_9TREM|nr:unnamed protein product [Schistosoma margrebowiei]
MKSSRPKEKRKTDKHITPRNGNGHEKNEQELDGIRKRGPGQSGSVNAGRRPMLHWEDSVLGLKKHHHKEWIFTETLDRMKERKNKKTAINNSRTRAEKVQAQAEYIEANKQVKNSIIADKKKYVEELVMTAEKAAREGNMRQLYDTTKKLAGNYSKPERPVKDKECRPVSQIREQKNRWIEYFEELLNRPAPLNSPNI